MIPNLRTVAVKIVDSVNRESANLDAIEAVENILKSQLPIQIHGSNTHVEITDEGIIVKNSNNNVYSGVTTFTMPNVKRRFC